MRLMLFCFAMVGLGACSGGFSEGPDEFSVVPQSPLEQPVSYSDLPEPVPGGSNLADLRPNADAVAALGGRTQAGGIPASDTGIVTYASRFGVDPAIRSVLFAEDERFRARISRRGIFGGQRENKYFSTYRSQALDAYAELERFRAAGISVPTAPPER
ncbi:MAG: DUF3035 domain-containing protein [Rhodobacteraceae bacterium]|nr:DUF3035 domain-containing protein [Paracoccaceae bacterium]